MNKAFHIIQKALIGLSLLFFIGCSGAINTKSNNGLGSGSGDPDPTYQSCQAGGVTVAHGQSYEFSRASTVPCGQTCQRQTRVCNNGTLTGDSSYASSSCTVNSCGSGNVYQVGPTRSYTNLNQLFNAVDLGPGDTVEVDGNHTYSGGVIVPSSDGGNASEPVTIRGIQINGRRPILSGGTNTIEFRQSNHVVFEGFEVTAGSSRCIFQAAHDITIRDSIIRDCPSHGLLSSDQYSGSLTFEYNEVRNSGQGDSRHGLYVQSDQIAYPNSVFLMRFNYIHSGTGGNLLKSRHERNFIYYNWFEGSYYHEIELIGPDADTQQNGWNINTRREDSDVVGNVIVHRRSGAAIRVGGDDVENSARGRTRFVNNTIHAIDGVSATIFRIFFENQSVEAHNNVISADGSGSNLRIERTVEAIWMNGYQFHGSNNSVKSGATYLPPNWTANQTHSTNVFSSENNYTPASGSPLVNAGNGNPVSASNPYPFANPLLVPVYHPPVRAKMSPGSEVPRNIIGSQIDIGAFERP